MCKHENFAAEVDVNRLLPKEGQPPNRFQADVRIKCAVCGQLFRFIGLPIGLDLNGAAMSPDGTEARLAVYPKGEAVPGLKDDQPAGFRILGPHP